MTDDTRSTSPVVRCNCGTSFTVEPPAGGIPYANDTSYCYCPGCGTKVMLGEEVLARARRERDER